MEVLETAAAYTAFACPACHGATSLVDPSRLACTACGASYRVEDGIPAFCASEDFYEEYLDEHCPYVEDPPVWKAAILRAVPYLSWREWRFFVRHLEPRGAVLDLGCARGKEWFTRRATFVAGVDPTRSVLTDCARHYDVVAQAEITALPFPSESFDYVVTSHVIGHIPFEHKDAAFAEIARVLKPGGRSLNIIETDSRHPFARLGKSDPELYRRNFIETDGHVGLELPSALLARFRRHGFDIERVSKMESGFIHLRYYGKYLGHGYPERHAHVRRRIRAWNWLSARPVPLAVYEVLVGTYHRAIEQWRTPLDNAMFVAVSAIKR